MAVISFLVTRAVCAPATTQARNLRLDSYEETRQHAPEDSETRESEIEQRWSIYPIADDRGMHSLPAECEAAKEYCARNCERNCVGSKIIGTICWPMDPETKQGCISTCVHNIETQSGPFVDLGCIDSENKKKGDDKAFVEVKGDQPKEITSNIHPGQFHANHSEVYKRIAASSPLKNRTATSQCSESTSCRAGQLICNHKCFGKDRIEVFLTPRQRSCVSRCQKDYDECHKMHAVATRTIRVEEGLEAYIPAKITEVLEQQVGN